MALGLAASDFLCVNLTLLSVILHMSDNLAGTTLLALGNGSPDVFGTYSAMDVGSGSLALGEIIGAALFISSVVLGAVALVKPFQVAKKTFIRDLLFFIGGIVLLFTFILNDGYLSVVECTVLVAYYGVFLLVTISWYWRDKVNVMRYLTNKRSREAYVTSCLPEFSQRTDHLDQSLIEAEEFAPDITNLGDSENLSPLDLYTASLVYGQGGNTPPLLVYDEISHFMAVKNKRPPLSRVRPSILQALELNDAIQSLREDGTIPIELESRNGTAPVKLPRPFTAPEVRYRGYPDEPNGPMSVSAPTRYRDDPNTPTESDATHFQKLNVFIKSSGQSDLRRVFLPHLNSFRKQSWVSQVCSVLCLPFAVLLNITVPMKPEGTSESRSAKYKRVLATVQAVLSLPTICFFWFGESMNLASMFIAVVVSLTFGVVTFQTLENDPPKWFDILFAVCGFATSICWISGFASEIIALLKTLGFIYRIDDAILGLTVFAIGNSIGDLVSNWSIAKGDAPAMAIAACFAGPLLNICGVGLNGLLIIPMKEIENVIVPGKGYRIEISSTLVMSGSMLLVSVFYTLIAVARNKWIMDRSIGLVLIGFWALPTFVSVLAEIFS
ncbi:hypothetical protein BABINDRAFT_159480 [Babjeviella inositovora NRRL Y-12698]|uniref:Sodium/calcium exchanger membrane region domain-containing protein n=1 Tax=Babjeviella inositovora NRRL Y-12698 TaxID=984486 RepID=A0A1E3R0X7_9ASCO|nr:uncharacterized protein BABINDRAFT_159480 [Babjeviella inositovora NRRL Y-12698]ODQ83002.1 hypothetical protein BABINDRAFT_159480 [Babjeviella inositovora NRRL Y-12698]